MTGLDWLVSRMSPSYCDAKLRAHSKRARVKLFVPLSSSAEGLPEEKPKKSGRRLEVGEKKIKWRTGKGIKSRAAARKERKMREQTLKYAFSLSPADPSVAHARYYNDHREVISKLTQSGRRWAHGATRERKNTARRRVRLVTILHLCLWNEQLEI